MPMAALLIVLPAGLIVMLVSVPTTTVVVPEIVPDVAFTVADPLPVPVARPVVLMVSKPVGFAVHLTDAVKSFVLLSS